VQSRAAISRRTLLGVAVVGIAGCGKHKKPQATTPAAVPDAAALLTARTDETRLLAAYDLKIRHATPHQRPHLEVERAIHATHLSALRGTASTPATGPLHPQLSAALRASAHQLRRLALAATAGSNAALFASIAASHEVSSR
jgi:hypothetical protein